MKYMTDASIAHVAPKLRERGIYCDTVHKPMGNNEYSQESISDGEIAAFLRKAEGAITLIVSDIVFADHLKWDNVPHITVWDAVANYILGPKDARVAEMR